MNRSVSYSGRSTEASTPETQENARTTVGRPKGYDREEVLGKAMELFWRQGFEATSTQQLVEHLGINRNSMYSEFGSKKLLYEAVLDYYSRLEMSPNFEPLEAPGAGLAEIYGLFDHYAQFSVVHNAGRGCLLANMTIEMAGADPRSLEISQAFIGRVQGAFENGLTNARAAGAVHPDTDLRTQAQFLTSAWLGVLVLLRSNGAPEIIQATARAAKEHLERLKGD